MTLPGSSDLIDHIIDLHQRLYMNLRGSLAEHWMETDYTMPQVKVLLFLYTDGRSRMSDLASALRVSLPTATGIIDRLVERGLVLREQDPGDRRVVICCLSPEGKRQMSDLWTASFDVLRRILQHLSKEDLDTVAHGTELMVKAANDKRESSTMKNSPHAARV